jgi:hypothetical protein
VLAARRMMNQQAITSIFDNFNRADSYPTGPIVTVAGGVNYTWAVDAPNYGISGDTFFMDGHANDMTGIAAVAGIDTGTPNGTVEWTGLRQQTGGPWFSSCVMWRGTKPGGYIDAFWYVNRTGDVVKLDATGGGTSPGVTVVTNVGAIPDNATVSVEVDASDNHTITVNGSVVATFTDSWNNTGTYFGAVCDQGSRFFQGDNFSFTP